MDGAVEALVRPWRVQIGSERGELVSDPRSKSSARFPVGAVLARDKMRSAGAWWASTSPVLVPLRTRIDCYGSALSMVASRTTAEHSVSISEQGAQFETLPRAYLRAVHSQSPLQALQTIWICCAGRRRRNTVVLLPENGRGRGEAGHK